MLFVTTDQVSKRQLESHDESIIYAPCPKRRDEAKRIITTINKAFNHVKLGSGIGLFEAQSIDNYDTEAVRIESRNKDEKDDWRLIDSKHLLACASSLSFFDPEGMRFSIPAFICSDLRGELDIDLSFHLSDLDTWKLEKFSALSTLQKDAVTEYIRFLSDDVAAEYFRETLIMSISTFWQHTN